MKHCENNGIAVLIRGPLAMGLLSGKYSESSVFTDSVRGSWNADGAERRQFEERVRMVNEMKRGLEQEEDMATTALRYLISHPTAAVAIPGAKSPEQAAANAKAGDRLLTALEL
jgi:myo-inositol catabolism protein IolS